MTGNEITLAISAFLIGWVLSNWFYSWAKSRIPKPFSTIIGESIVETAAKIRTQNIFCGDGVETSQISQWKRDGEIDVFIIVTSKDQKA